MASLSVRLLAGTALSSAALFSPLAFAQPASTEPAPTSTAPAPTTTTAPAASATPAAASATGSASVKIGTSDGKGLIYIDEKIVGEGSYVGELSAGTHKLKVTREGFDPFEEDLVVKDKEPLARTITLKLSSTITTGTIEEERDRPEGIYGGFGLLFLPTPGGTGNSIASDCDAKGKPGSTIASCDVSDGSAFGVGGFVGYHWDPVGVELYLAGHYDQRTITREQNAPNTDLGVGPDPARHEELKLRRAGGMGLARIRLTWQTKRIRLSFAAGAGISYRVLFLERLTTAKDNSGARDLFVSSNPTYVSPVIAFEPTVLYRLTPGVAVSAGLQLFLETPTSFLNDGETPKTQAESSHSLGMRSLTTRPYELASGVQVFVGPVIGMMFGP